MGASFNRPRGGGYRGRRYSASLPAGRSDPFFCDVEGAKNNLQFTGDDFFGDKDVCSIVLEIPNSAFGAERGSPVGSHAHARRCGGWIQVERERACSGRHSC